MSGWARNTQDRWFYYALAVSTASVAALFWPYLDVLLFAVTTAAVSSPMHARLVRAVDARGPLRAVFSRIGGTRLWCALAIMLGLALVVFVPLGVLAYRFTLEGIALAQRGIEWVSSGSLDVWMGEASDQWAALSEAWSGYVPSEFDPVAAASGPLREALNAGFGQVSQTLPSLLGGVITGVIDLLLFVFTVVTLLAEGPQIIAFGLALSPLDDRYERRLIDVFQEFAANMVVGAFGTALAQGVVAAAGYAFVGLPRPIFFATLTAIGSFVPVVGTGVVVVPAVIYIAVVEGFDWGLGLMVYAVVVIGSVDNLLRPLFMRGSSEMHPLLIFLAVFGGMSWMGVTGVLVGPVLVAFFLALATIHREDFSSESPPEA